MAEIESNDSELFVVADDGRFHHIGSVKGGPVLGQNGEAVAPADAEGIRFASERKVEINVDTSHFDRELLNHLAIAGHTRDEAPMLNQVWDQLHTLAARGETSRDRVVMLTRSQHDSLRRSLPDAVGLNGSALTVFGMPVRVVPDDHGAAPKMPLLVSDRPLVPGVTVGEAALMFARAGEAFRDFGAAMRDLQVRTAEATWSIRNVAFWLAQCNRCGHRPMDRDRLEPGLCTECNERRFWMVVAVLMAALVVLAVVAKVVAG